jgi:hypothetical protein
MKSLLASLFAPELAVEIEVAALILTLLERARVAAQPAGALGFSCPAGPRACSA